LRRRKAVETGHAEQIARKLVEAAKLADLREAGTDIANVAEQKALEKAGFRRDGVMRQAQYRDGTWHDTAMYSRPRSDPG